MSQAPEEAEKEGKRAINKQAAKGGCFYRKADDIYVTDSDWVVSVCGNFNNY